MRVPKHVHMWVERCVIKRLYLVTFVGNIRIRTKTEGWNNLKFYLHAKKINIAENLRKERTVKERRFYRKNKVDSEYVLNLKTFQLNFLDN